MVVTTPYTGADSQVITVTASSLAKTSTDHLVSSQSMAQSTRLAINSPTPIQKQEHSASLPTAIGVGIGLPLGIATIGLLGFLIWKEAAQQRRNKPQTTSLGSVANIRDQSAIAAADAAYAELLDTQRPGELGNKSPTELPGI